MFRKRLVAVSMVASLVLSGTFVRSAHAQEVIDLDDAAPAKKPAGGAKKPGGGGKKGGVDIDLDEGAPASGAAAAVTAGQMTESAAAAKQLAARNKATAKAAVPMARGRNCRITPPLRGDATTFAVARNAKSH